MRIATWNVNGLRSRLDFVLHWLEARRPDWVGLQEIKVTEDQFPALEFEAAGYHSLVHGQKAWNGVAFLSREPAEIIARGLPNQDEQGSRLIHARCQGIEYATVYCPNGKSVGHEDYPMKLKWFEDLADYLAPLSASDRPFLIGGDFNICPTELDTWNEAGFTGKIFHTAEERTRFQRLLESGLVDLYREQNPDTRAFSWWDYRMGAFHKKQGLRIDLLLGTRAIADRVRAVEIDREYRKKKDGLTASDHAPVWVDLD